MGGWKVKGAGWHRDTGPTKKEHDLQGELARLWDKLGRGEGASLEACGSGGRVGVAQERRPAACGVGGQSWGVLGLAALRVGGDC